MTQPLAEWLAEVKARLAEAATSLEAWNGACEMDEVGQTHLTLEAELALSRRKERAEDAVRDSAITDLARAVEELDRLTAELEGLEEGLRQEQHEAWNVICAERAKHLAALEAALRPTP